VVTPFLNAQEINNEVIDTPVEIAIEETPAAQPEQEVTVQAPLEEPVAVTEPPIVEEPIIIDPPTGDWYDDTRLQIMSAQALSFESTGEYTQISKEAEIIDGDSITFEAVKDELFTGKEEVHVYEAPCGRGWQLIITETEVQNVFSSTTKQYLQTTVPIIRSYGYGCEHTSRTFNW